MRAIEPAGPVRSESRARLRALGLAVTVAMALLVGVVALPTTAAAANDTTPPTVGNVQLAENSGNVAASFQTDEPLGDSTTDVTVPLVDPNGGVLQTFTRDDFAESGSGPYTYTLTADVSYSAGDGTYTVEVVDAKDPAGNNGGTNGAGTGLTDSYTYGSSSTASVVSTDIEYIDGSATYKTDADVDKNIYFKSGISSGALDMDLRVDNKKRSRDLSHSDVATRPPRSGCW